MIVQPDGKFSYIANTIIIIIIIIIIMAIVIAFIDKVPFGGCYCVELGKNLLTKRLVLLHTLIQFHTGGFE
jgi:hypothetical protein